MLFLLSNSQIVDTAEGNLTAGQFIGVDIDSGNKVNPKVSSQALEIQWKPHVRVFATN